MAVDGFKIADAYVEIHIDDDAAKREVGSLGNRLGPEGDRAGRQVGTSVGRGVGKTLGPEAQRSGREGGDKLSKGMEMAVVRNSPLIVAGIAGALSAGAPVALAGASVLFQGIGVVAAAQSLSVRTAWRQTWESVRDDTIKASEPIQGVLVRLADVVEGRFANLLPQISAGFAAAAPQLVSFTDAVFDAADNALPGLIDAVENGGAVVAGLGDLVRDVGSGLGDFFSTLSDHSGSAGRAFSALGQAVGTLLPILGELLGRGADLAAVMLPALNVGLGAVLSTVQFLGPILPTLGAGFTGLKIAQTATGWIGSLGSKLGELGGSMQDSSGETSAFGGILEEVGGRVSDFAEKAGPILSAALAAAIMVLSDSEEQTQAWTDALNAGGLAADQARAEMSELGSTLSQLDSGLVGVALDINGVSGAVGAYADDVDAATKAHHDWWQSLTPVEQAQAKVTEWTGRLARALRDEGKGSDEAEAAQRRLDHWTGELENSQGDLEDALNGVTAAMIEQADQALAAIDSGFAYRHSIDQLEDAQQALNDAIKEHGRKSEEAQRASLDLEEQNYRVAESYAKQQADLSGLKEGSAEYNRLIQTETLTRLVQLRNAAGPEMAAAIQLQIDKLSEAGVGLAELDSKSASPTVDADLNPFAGKMAAAYADVDNLDSQRPTPVAGFGLDILTGHYTSALGMLGNLHRQRPVPVANLQTGPLTQWYNYATGKMSTLNAQRPTPVASLIDRASGPALNIVDIIGRIRDKYVTVTVAQQFIGASASGSAAFGADGGATEDILAGARRYDAGGAVRGPGGPRDDLVPAVGPGGARMRLSPGEHVLDALDVDLMGGQRAVYAFRDALNRGRVDGTAIGGRSITVQQLSVNVTGTFDLRDPGAVRKFAVAVAPAVRDALVDEEAKYR